MGDEFKNKVVFVTGGTSGIGRITAIEFAKHGAKVAITGRREKEGKETLDAIKAHGAEGLFIQSDVSKADDVERAINETVEKLGDISVAFNNAGIEEEPTPFLDQTVDVLDRIHEVNVKGVWLCMQAQIRNMMKHGKGGTIVNNASVAGLQGMAGVSAYCASKHAVIGMSKSLASEFAKKNIRINVVAPGPIQTDMWERFAGDKPQVQSMVQNMVPMGRLGSSEEVASCVLWLAHPTASYVTGQVVAVDGGLVIS